MKKLVLIAILSLVPFTAFALDAMNDLALDEVTAQDGVTITFEGVIINQAPADIGWADTDGYGSNTTGGYILLDNTAGSDTITLDNTSLTIDIATALAGEAIGDSFAAVAIDADPVTYVRIGLPSLTMGSTAKTTEISLGSGVAFTPGQRLGTLYQNTTGQTTVVGSMYIYAH